MTKLWAILLLAALPAIVFGSIDMAQFAEDEDSATTTTAANDLTTLASDKNDSDVGGSGERSGYEVDYQPNFGGGLGSSGAEGGMSCNGLRFRNKCFFLGLSKESWYTARDYCNKIGQTLVRIESSDEATFLASYLSYQGGNQFWIDANDEKMEGVWIRGDNTEAYVDFWARGEPNGNRGENCGLLVAGQDRIGRLVDDPCGEWRRFICQRQTEYVCRRGGYKRKCYWFSVQPANWFSAREYCATMGMRIARVSSSDEMNFLARTQPRNSWVDLRYSGQGVSFVAPQNMYGPGAFVQKCSEIVRYDRNEGRAIGSDCMMMKPFICESEPLPPGSELNEDEPFGIQGHMHMGPGVFPNPGMNPMMGQQMMGQPMIGNPMMGQPMIGNPMYGGQMMGGR